MGMMVRKSPLDKRTQANFSRLTGWSKVKDDRTCGPVTEGMYNICSPYPSLSMSMGWIAFAGEDRGVYVSSHDKNLTGKDFTVYFIKRVAPTISGSISFYPLRDDASTPFFQPS
mgnify:CR=1 FL=1